MKADRCQIKNALKLSDTHKSFSSVCRTVIIPLNCQVLYRRGSSFRGEILIGYRQQNVNALKNQ